MSEKEEEEEKNERKLKSDIRFLPYMKYNYRIYLYEIVMAFFISCQHTQTNMSMYADQTVIDCYNDVSVNVITRMSTDIDIIRHIES